MTLTGYQVGCHIRTISSFINCFLFDFICSYLQFQFGFKLGTQKEETWLSPNSLCFLPRKQVTIMIWANMFCEKICSLVSWILFIECQVFFEYLYQMSFNVIVLPANADYIFVFTSKHRSMSRKSNTIIHTLAKLKDTPQRMRWNSNTSSKREKNNREKKKSDWTKAGLHFTGG